MIGAAAHACADLDELCQLARLVAGQPDLELVEGPPGSGWSFSPILRRISMDGHRLRTESRNFTRGLLLHETGHAAITRLHDWVKGKELRRPDLFGLVNAVEDCRLETYLADRFPGSRPWIREYNDVLLKARIPEPRRLGEGGLPPLGHFVAALLGRWWHGAEKVEMPEILRPWVDEAWPHLEAICRCLPRAATTPARSASAYHVDPVSRMYAGVDLLDPPTPWEMEVRMAQAAMWRIFESGLLPIARRLTPPSRPAGVPTELESMFERWLQEHHLGPNRVEDGDSTMPAGGLFAELSAPQRRPGSRFSRSGSGEAGPRWSSDPHAYAAAVAGQEAAIERLGATVLRILQPRTHRRWHGPNRRGIRLHLAGARRAESDPRFQDLVWERPGEPRRPDPLMVLLLDRSGSMEGPKIQATLQGSVLLAEVCHRLGIALGIYTFAGRCERILGWQETLDAGTQGRLGGLVNGTGGSTCLEGALWRVHADLAEYGYGERLVVVLSDGEPDDGEHPESPIRALEQDGVRVMGLGVGPDTGGLSKYLPRCRTGLSPDWIPEAFAGLLLRAVKGR